MTTTVVHLVNSFGVGGLERVLVNLINQTRSIDLEHIIVTQVPEKSFASKLIHEVQIFCLDKKSGKDIVSHIRLYKLLRQLKPDVLHTYNFGTLEYQGVGWLVGVPIRIHAEHGQETLKKLTESAKMRGIVKHVAVRLLTYFVVVSRDLHKWATETLMLSSDKLKLVFNGIDLKEFEVESVLDIGRHAFTFVSVGRLVDVKNYELLLNAFSVARNQNKNFQNTRLLIVGDGPNRQVLQKQILELRLADSVKLLGYSDDIPSLFKEANVFVLSSRYEAQPMTALEAMACGLPVIATDVGGLAYLVSNEKNGLLVENENPLAMAKALIYANDNQEAMRKLGAFGRDLVMKEYSIQVMSQQYLSLYGMPA